MKYRNVILTGSTGILGQHILFELLRNIITNKFDVKIFLIVRSSNNCSSEDRVRLILENPFAPDFIKEYTLESLMKFICVVDTDLVHLDENILRSVDLGNCCLIHCAANTNLSNSEDSELVSKLHNYTVTVNLLRFFVSRINKFVYISTAFSCGIVEGIIDNNYLDFEEYRFRNHYEKFKQTAESYISSTCKNNNVKFQILRPSIICGRLIEPSLYFTPKFDVFYGYAKFFYRLKNTPLYELPIRVWSNIDHGSLNIVPVDYVAKSIVRSINSDEIVELNITSTHSVPLKYLLPILIEVNDYDKYTFVNEMPSDLNDLEVIYYDRVSQFVPYITNDNYNFDTTHLRDLMSDLEEPNVISYIYELINFAKANSFKSLIDWSLIFQK